MTSSSRPTPSDASDASVAADASDASDAADTAEAPSRRGLLDAEVDFNTWTFWQQADPAAQQAQRERLEALAARGARLGEGCVVSAWSACYPDSLELGEGSYLAAFSYVTGDVRIGARSSVNAYAVVRGDVRIGDGVRIGAHTSILGFDHQFAPDAPVHRQPLVSAGITIGDDVYIGSNACVVDGVRIGAHSVVGAGAVVTRDLPEWSIAVGSPARVIRDRRDTGGGAAGAGGAAGRGADGPAAQLAGLIDAAREQAPAVLERCWDAQQDAFVDTPGAPPTVRALCDAVEIADLLGLGLPPQLPREEIVRRLTARQDPAIGLIPEIGQDSLEATPTDLAGGRVRYHVLSAGYALDLLGERLPHPIRIVDELRGAELRDALEQQPWATNAWGAGDWVDVVGTAQWINRAWFDLPGDPETLLGWLLLHADRSTGAWGDARPEDGLRQVVNGFYRASRGTFAQAGVPVPHPERVIDTVLAHAADERRFGPGRATACDVLDIAHPLWLAGQQSAHRREEARAWAAGQVPALVAAWTDAQGFGFAQRTDGRGQATPGLQGTEMWLAISWYLADLLGCAGALGIEPRGVHRPWAR